MKRPTWDEYFMKITNLVAERSTCMRRMVGAIIVKDKKIVSTGYNGAPKGLKHCLEIGCLREELGIPSGERHELCRGAHAEQNAIIQAAGSGNEHGRRDDVLHRFTMLHLHEDDNKRRHQAARARKEISRRARRKADIRSGDRNGLSRARSGSRRLTGTAWLNTEAEYALPLLRT